MKIYLKGLVFFDHYRIISIMLTLQCTQKLLKEVTAEISPLKDTDPIALWHANLMFLDRRKCVIFTNDESRYTFLVPGLRKTDFAHLGEVFLENLFRCMLNDGIQQRGVERVLNVCGSCCFSKSSSRSVLGTMNDVASIVKWTVVDHGGLINTDLSKLIVNINRMPMKPLDYGYSVEAFKKMLG